MDIDGIFRHVGSKIRAKIILSLKVILGCVQICKLQYVNLNIQSNMHVSMRVACCETMKGKKEHHTTGQGASNPSRPGRPGSPFSPLKPRKPCL